MRLVAVLYWCLGAAAKHVLFDHTINAGPLGLDLDGQLAVTGFGKRGAYHPLAVAGVKIGDVIVQVDGEAQPPGGLARPRTLPRRYREARARLNEDWPQRRRIRFRREVGQDELPQDSIRGATGGFRETRWSKCRHQNGALETPQPHPVPTHPHA